MTTNTAVAEKPVETAEVRIGRRDPAAAVLRIVDSRTVAVRAGTEIVVGTTVHRFAADTPVGITAEDIPGRDYVVSVLETGELVLSAWTGAIDAIGSATAFAGFHFAPGGNAPARAGGDSTPAINPHSLWDLGYRPACPDPRGMTCVTTAAGRFWCDIYLTAADHLEKGTSWLGATIADGRSLPQKPGDGRFGKFDWDTARAVLAHHGKQLISVEEFFAAAYGVTERSSAGRDPDVTKLDTARTSKWGLMQAAGNMSTWGHDGDPDPARRRATLLGGDWGFGEWAGSRYALVELWPDFSAGWFAARGRSDHLQLA